MDPESAGLIILARIPSSSTSRDMTALSVWMSQTTSPGDTFSPSFWKGNVSWDFSGRISYPLPIPPREILSLQAIFYSQRHFFWPPTATFGLQFPLLQMIKKQNKNKHKSVGRLAKATFIHISLHTYNSNVYLLSWVWIKLLHLNCRPPSKGDLHPHLSSHLQFKCNNFIQTQLGK